MELSTFATIIGILELMVGLSLLLAGAATAAFVLQLLHNDAFMRVMGVTVVIMTVLVLQDGYQISTSAEGLVRLVAWIGLIKGIAAAWFPGFLVGVSERILASPAAHFPLGGIAVAVGVLLLYGAQLV